jgi:GNAT superfamily N-acetyltransferase
MRSDGAALQSAMESTAQRAEGFTFVFVNTPDFFSRANAYDDATVFLAEEGGEVAGSAAVAVREAIVNGVPRQIAYEFQYFTDAKHRRKGVARRLREEIESHLRLRGVDLTTAVVAGNNEPSKALFAGAGFRMHAELTGRFMTVHPHADLRRNPAIRRATVLDLEGMARLLNDTWGGRDFYQPLNADTLESFYRRTPAIGLDRTLVYEEDGEILACAGMWDWSAVQQMRVETVDPGLDGKGFHAGTVLRNWGISPVGFRDPDHLLALLRVAGNRAVEDAVAQIALVDDARGALTAAGEGLPGLAVPLGFWVKPLRPGLALSDRPVYLDMIDL